MNRPPDIWDGSSMGPGPVSLFLCESESGNRDQAPEVMFGAASNGEMGINLFAEQVSLFLRRHQNATLVCYDAAGLHWLLHEYLQRAGDEEAVQILWRFSGDCRLVDVAILEQHVRRIRESDATPSRQSLSRLIERYTGERFPGVKEFRQRVAVPVSASGGGLDVPFFTLFTQAALALSKVYESLVLEARQIKEWLQTVQTSRRPTPVDVSSILLPQLPRLDGDDAEQLGSAGTSSGLPLDGFAAPREFGLLGVGLDVMGDIALRHAHEHRAGDRP